MDFRCRASRNAQRQAVFVPPPFFFAAVQPGLTYPNAPPVQYYQQECPSQAHMQQMDASQNPYQEPVDSVQAPPQPASPLQQICQQIIDSGALSMHPTPLPCMSNKTRTPLFDIFPRTPSNDQ